MGQIITCPRDGCGFAAEEKTFQPSCADECECPKCGENFVIVREDDEE